ncbi:hypothetical protein HMPREF1548_06703 [Clostridium sp. KLE 1755]|nr:hypothetical protein HMPREF1548_06703 [Clostridium sp. KLE 1755]
MFIFIYSYFNLIILYKIFFCKVFLLFSYFRIYTHNFSDN